ncbi:hypothetical protein CJJ09_004381 [Candidozyma auris]|nr:hypothetical protein CJJ09_004381 [[Candida] auris]
MRVLSKIFASSIVNFDTSAPRKTLADTESPIDDEKAIKEFSQLHDKIPGNILKPDSKVLDFACGTGLVAQQLCPFMPKGEYLGIDINESMLESYEEKARFLQEKYPEFKMRSVCADIMDKISTSVAEELKRMVKPGGWILIYDFYNEDLEKEEITRELQEKGMARHGVTVDEMNECLEKNCVNVSSAREMRVDLWQNEVFIETHCTEAVKQQLKSAPRKGELFLVPCSVILGIAQKKQG